jgi:hypothetical protein
VLGYSQAAANAAAAASAGGRLVNPSSIEESNPSPSVAVLGASATDTGGDHSRSISFSAGRHSSSKTYLWLKSNFHKKPTFELTYWICLFSTPIDLLLWSILWKDLIEI